MKKGVSKYIVAIINLMLITSIVKAENIEGMENAQKAFNESQSKKLVSFISIEELFPNKSTRALAEAAGKGDISKIEELVAQGVDVNSMGFKKTPPLFWTTRTRNLSGFRRLLELRADPNMIFGQVQSVMHWAARIGNHDFLKLALEHGGNPNHTGGINGKTPIFETISLFGDVGSIPALELLLAAGANVNVKIAGEATPVFEAANIGRFDIVYTLLTNGADYHAKNQYGQRLMDLITGKKAGMNPNHELFHWLEKTLAWLESKGPS